MMKKYKCIIPFVTGVLFMMLTALPCRAQQDPLFTHYITNRMLLNPAFTGIRNHAVASTLYRTQWVNKVDGAPDTYTLSFHTPLNNSRIGLGLYYLEDHIGPTTEREIATSYAYHLPFDNSKLSFGLEFGFKFLSFGLDGNTGNTSDPAFSNISKTAWKPNFNIGVQYRTEKFFLGLSTKDLLNQEYTVSEDQGGEKIGYTTNIHYYFIGGVYIPIGSDIVLRPSTMVKYVENSDVDVDVTVMAYYKDKFAVGIAGRTENAICGLLQYEITDRLLLGYSYDYYHNDLSTVNSGSHEFHIEYSFNLSSKGNGMRIKTPRFF